MNKKCNALSGEGFVIPDDKQKKKIFYIHQTETDKTKSEEYDEKFKQDFSDEIKDSFEKYYGNLAKNGWAKISFKDFYSVYEQGYKTALNKKR